MLSNIVTVFFFYYSDFLANTAAVVFLVVVVVVVVCFTLNLEAYFYSVSFQTSMTFFFCENIYMKSYFAKTDISIFNHFKNHVFSLGIPIWSWVILIRLEKSLQRKLGVFVCLFVCLFVCVHIFNYKL